MEQGKTMSKLEQLIAKLCPNGVEGETLGSRKKRRIQSTQSTGKNSWIT